MNGSLKTTELKKKTHPSRLVGWAQTWNRLVPHPWWWIKIQEEYLGSKESQPGMVPIPGASAQGFSARKTSLHNSWLQTPARIELVEVTERQAIPLKEFTHGLT